MRRVTTGALLVAVTAWAVAAEESPITALPDHADKFLIEYCLNCHDEVEEKGGMNLDMMEIDWRDPHAATPWVLAYEMLESGEMPPKKKQQPSLEERHAMLGWLDEILTERDPPGGTVLRRLNRAEYENSVSDILGLKYKAPDSFPADLEFHGFDNVGAGLVISPPLMAQYFEVATAVADQIIPATEVAVEAPVETTQVGPNEFTLNFTTGHPIDGVLRMVSSSDPLARGSVWPNRFEAKVTGMYTVEIDLSRYRSMDGHVPLVKLLAFHSKEGSFARASALRDLAAVRVDADRVRTHTFEVDLQKGETVVVHYDNAALNSDGDEDQLERNTADLLRIFREDPLLGAAWKIADYQRSDRGWSWWNRIQEIKNQPGFSAEGFDPESEEVAQFAQDMARKKVNLVETMCCYRFFQGPGLDVHALRITGPMPAERNMIQVAANEFTSVDFTGSLTEAQRYRLISSRDLVAGSLVWPLRFEAKVSGVYAVGVDIEPFEDGHSFFESMSDQGLLEVYARESSAGLYEPVDSMRKLAEFRFNPQRFNPQEFVTEVELIKGETLGFRWGNSPLYSDEGSRQFSAKSFAPLSENRRIHAAYQRLGRAKEFGAADYYDEVMRLAESSELDLDDPALDKAPNFETGPANGLFARLARQDLIRHGPAVDILQATIDGPLRLVEDNEMKAQRLRTEGFMGERQGRGDREFATAILHRFLSKAFRRPATSEQVAKYVDIAIDHVVDGRRFKDGIHLAIRAALCSPQFLYRGMEEGVLDDYDLASRLSYFLTGSPPDDKLLALAATGSLSEPKRLALETRRLLGSSRVDRFLDSFTGQWLDLRLLPEIMPDSRLLNWNDNYLDAITAETQMFIAEILRENHPMETFIDPDFTYLNSFNAKLYGHKFKGDKEMERVALELGGRYGGILGQASVMMATANGVDTQPVLRGVWLLENVLGDPVPEPPANIPAVEPDTSGATSIRELLTRHQADPGCASCHSKIDPPGFALENFDPIGRWRTSYPVYELRGEKVVKRDGLTVDATGQLADGTRLNDVIDLKRYLVENIDVFSRCLTEKLMIYATGRALSYGDRQEIKAIVARTEAKGNGFADLIVELVLSDSFLTR
ncbi:DUF1592 domain-containing protein [Opitutaceae bacterium]|nr:DUF1592 domain-containing protein [Opitutaceae bacterium]